MKNSYINDPKFSNNLLSHLRIFFERNVKNNKAFSALGQLYASSKWSLFSKNSIKIALKKSLLYVVFPLLFFLLSAHLFLGKTSLYSTYVALVGESFVSSSGHVMLSDATTRVFVAFGSVYMFLARFITYYIEKTVLGSDLTSIKFRSPKIKLKPQENSFKLDRKILGSRAAHDRKLLEASRSFFKVANALQLLKQPSFTKPFAGRNLTGLPVHTVRNNSYNVNLFPEAANLLMGGGDLAAANRLCLSLEKALRLSDTRLRHVNSLNYGLSALAIVDNINFGKQQR
jgi:hypothetical protein